MKSFQDHDPGMLLNLEEELKQFLEKCTSGLGLSPTVGKLIAYFSFNEGTFLQRDLSENLSVSISAISRGLKSLEHWGIVEKKAISGSKERLYSRKSTSFFNLFNEIIVTAIEDILLLKEELAQIKEKWYIELTSEEQESPRARQILEISSGLIEWVDIFIELAHQARTEISSRSQNSEKRLEVLFTTEGDSKDRQTYLE